MASLSGTSSIPTSSLDARVREVVKHYWGFDELRPLQAQAIEAGLSQRDSLVVLPTGGGKSLCYQVPPVVEDRFDVVISPLISLMKDQVDGLRENGYPAAAVHSNLTPTERRVLREGIRNRQFRLLFVSPERLVQPEFLSFLDRQDIRAFAIDEAHCISQWGHDFRKEYRQLAQLKDRFPNASIHAYTATATKRVQQDIIAQLGLRNPHILVGTFDRPNLVYRILPKTNEFAQALEIIRRHPKEAAIVYCLSRNDTEDMATYLTSQGVNAAAYHAGMEKGPRTKVQERFAAEDLDVIAATVAFGMGIDRSNVRCIIHASMPKTIEHYQQETGRAGRDGLEAECVLLYSARDAMRWEKLISKSAEQAEDPESVIAAGMELLRHMRGLCGTLECRHRALSRYFGQTYPRDNCGGCDVCLGEVESMADSTDIARKILSCIYRINQRFGVGHLVSVLRGANTDAVRKNRHDQLSTYGILREMDEGALTNLVYQLLDQGLIRRSGGDRPVLQLGEEAGAVLRGGRSVRLLDPGRVAVRKSKADTSSWEGVDRDLFDHLRVVRKQLALERQVPAFVIFSDAVLRELARLRPASLKSMKRISGIGEKKLADIGQKFVDMIVVHCRAHGLSMDAFGQGVPSAAPPEKRPNAMKEQAMAMFRAGAQVADVARAIGRAESTTWQYLEEFIAKERPKSVEPWVDGETYKRVIAAAAAAADDRLGTIFEALNKEIPYGVIRIVLAHRMVWSEE